RGLFYSLADPLIRSAATDVTLHGFVDLMVNRFRIFLEQRRRLHELTALAVAALRHIALLPGFLQRVVSPRTQSLYGHDPFPGHAFHRRYAAAHRFSIYLYRTGTAKPLAAAVFRTGQVQFVAQIP